MSGIKHELFVDRTWRGPDVEFYLTARSTCDGNINTIATNVTFEPMALGVSPDPSFKLQPESAQDLMDGLWRLGFRPTEGRQSEGVTAAQLRHLEDMRALVFDRLKVEKP